jgi:glucose/arabinose dehydrogenase
MSRILTVRRVLLLCFLVAAIVSAWLVQFALQTSAATASVPAGWPTIVLTPITMSVTKPVYVTHANDGSGRIFIVEREGSVRIYKNGALLATPFLSITGRVESGYEEQGLLSIAFPPSYALKQHFYVYYTNLNNDVVISRFQVTADPDVASAISETIILTINHPSNLNHNGGQLQFGPSDGYLYLGTGDGGGGGDVPNNAQNHGVLLGKMLRLDVETGNPVTYTVPPSNPYTATAGFKKEIWALGLRNPWRFSFDRQTHDLYIGDVGQDTYEEVDRQSAASHGGENYGWRLWEGFHCFNPPSGCATPPQYSPPITEYTHSLGCAIVGGYVYRGTRFVLTRGIYFYADHCTGRIWGLRFNGTNWDGTELMDTGGFGLSSFGEDEAANLYVADIDSGIVYRIDSVESNVYLPVIAR